MKPHDFADLFPLMNPDEFEQLEQDIKRNGLLEPIVMYKGQVLDGRNREYACQSVGITPDEIEFEGTDEEAIAYVLSKNLVRRHLDTTRKVILGVNLLPTLEDKAKRRQGMQERDPKTGQVVGPLPVNLPEVGEARDQAGAMVGVSGRYITEGKRIKETYPDLWERMEQGLLTIVQAISLRKIADKSTFAKNTLLDMSDEERGTAISQALVELEDSTPDEVEDKILLVAERVDIRKVRSLLTETHQWPSVAETILTELMFIEDKEPIANLTDQLKDDIVYLYDEVLPKL